MFLINKKLSFLTALYLCVLFVTQSSIAELFDQLRVKKDGDTYLRYFDPMGDGFEECTKHQKGSITCRYRDYRDDPYLRVVYGDEAIDAYNKLKDRYEKEQQDDLKTCRDKLKNCINAYNELKDTYEKKQRDEL